MALKGVCQFQLHRFPWAARGWSYELTLVYKFWLSNHIVTVTLSQCGFGSEMAWDQAIPGAHFQEFDGVLICSGCYNKIPQTRHLINNRNVFRTVVGTASPGSGCQHGQVLERALFWIADCWLLPVSSHSERYEGALWSLFYNGTNSIHEGSAFITDAPLRSPHLLINHFGH